MKKYINGVFGEDDLYYNEKCQEGLYINGGDLYIRIRIIIIIKIVLSRLLKVGWPTFNIKRPTFNIKFFKNLKKSLYPDF